MTARATMQASIRQTDMEFDVCVQQIKLCPGVQVSLTLARLHFVRAEGTNKWVTDHEAGMHYPSLRRQC